MPNKSYRALVPTLAGLVIAVSAPFAHAAPQADADSNASAAAPSVIALSAPRTAARAASSTAPLTMLVEDAAGDTVRLTHVPGAGWKYDRIARADPSLRQTSLRAPPAGEADVDADAPLTVFIDGPSGFTYVWNRDAGWKYIGKLVDDAL